LEQQCKAIDEEVADYIINNPLIQLLKSGIIYKKSEGALQRWQERFMLLTNCGILYFKPNSLQPQKFKLLNNFIVKPLEEKEEKRQGRKFCFKISFNKLYTKRDLLISC